jgi:hypothetical protein
MRAPLQLFAPWVPIDPADSERFEDEYAVEIGKVHPLYGVPVRAVARRVDCDDVLFELLRHLCEYAVVHLTWSGREESDPRWPSCQIYTDADDLMEQRIKPDHEEYEA